MAEQVSSLRTGVKYKDTPIGKIPVDWEIVRLGEICNVVGGSTPSTSRKEYWGGEIPFATPTDITSAGGREISETAQKITPEGLSSCGTNLLPPGTILLTSRATIGACAISTKPMATHQGFANLVCKERACNWFVFYNVISRKHELEKIGSASTFREVSKSSIRSLLVALPPLSEQRRISEILATVDEAIDKTAQVIEKTREIKRGLMQQLLTRGIGHQRFKKTPIGEIPEEWEVKRLIDTASSEECSFTGKPFGSDLKEDSYTDHGVRIIQLQNIGDGHFLHDYKIFTSKEKANELRNCNIYPGDIIISKMADPLARACIIPERDERYLMASDGIRLSVNKRKYDTRFIAYVINSSCFRRNAERHSIGTACPRIGLTELKNLPIAIPSLKEQEEISAILCTIEQEMEEENKQRRQLESLKQGLMQVLLTGKVRVPVSS